jgi:hypothetical protein
MEKQTGSIDTSALSLLALQGAAELLLQLRASSARDSSRENGEIPDLTSKSHSHPSRNAMQVKADNNYSKWVNGKHEIAAAIAVDPRKSNRELAAILGTSIESVRKVRKGITNFGSSPVGGRPKSLPEGVERELLSIISEFSASGRGLSGNEITLLAQAAWRPLGFDIRKMPIFGKEFRRHLRKSYPDLKLSSKSPKAADVRRLKATNPQNVYRNAMSLKNLVKLLHSKEEPAKYVDSSRIHFLDECSFAISQGEVSSESHFTTNLSPVIVPTKLDSRHLSVIACANLNGFIDFTAIIVAGKPMIELEGPNPSAFESLVIYNSSGSVKSVDGSGKIGAMFVICKQLIDSLNEICPLLQRGWHALMVDGAAVHLCEASLEFLYENKIMVHVMLPYLTAEVQISDHSSLHGILQKMKRTFYSQSVHDGQSVVLSDEPGFIHSLVRGAFTVQNTVLSPI